MTIFQAGNGDNLKVMQGRKCLGFIMPFAISGEVAWRFLRRAGDDPRFPMPAPKHATRDDAVKYVMERMSGGQ
jgi:hypothetical protein